MLKEQQDTFIDNTLSDQNQSNSQCSEDYNEMIEGSPLWIVKNKEEGWLLVFGNYRLKEGKTKEELKIYVEFNALNIVVDLISIILEIQNQKPQ